MFVRAKAWHIFVLICLIVPVIYFFGTVNLPTTLGFILILLANMLYFGWQWFIAQALRPHLPAGVKQSPKLFRINIVYCLFSHLVFVNAGLQAMLDSSWTILLKIAYAYYLFALIYNFYFLAKLLVAIEQKRSVRLFGDFFGTFLLFLFKIIGVWFIQPRVHKIIFAKYSEPELAAVKQTQRIWSVGLLAFFVLLAVGFYYLIFYKGFILAESQIVSGAYQIQKGQLNEASETFSTVIKDYPGNGNAYLMRAYVKLQNHDYEAAQADLKQAKNNGANINEVFFYTGIVYAQTKNFQGCVDVLSQAIGTGTTRPELYNTRAFCYHELEQDQKSRDDLQQACQLGNKMSCFMLQQVSGQTAPSVPNETH